MKTVKQLYQESKKSKQKTKIGPLSSLLLDYWRINVSPDYEYRINQNDNSFILKYPSFVSREDEYMTNLSGKEKVYLDSYITIDEDVKLLKLLTYIGPVIDANYTENYQELVEQNNSEMDIGNFEFDISDDVDGVYLRFRSTISLEGIKDKNICLTVMTNHLNVSFISCGYYLNNMMNYDFMKQFLRQSKTIL